MINDEHERKISGSVTVVILCSFSSRKKKQPDVYIIDSSFRSIMKVMENFSRCFFFLFVSSQRVGCGLVSLKIVIGFFFVFFLFWRGRRRGKKKPKLFSFVFVFTAEEASLAETSARETRERRFFAVA